MQHELTREDRDILKYMRRHIRENDSMPTVRELADAFGWKSPTTALNRINGLIRKGHLERVKTGKNAFRFSRNGGGK
jgi:SOS-response transcriptional repressor LexA